LVSSIFGIFIGSIAAYYGGIIDEILMRIVDVFMAIPFLIAAMVLTTLLGNVLSELYD
jgi:peptide/nickel transport system permease protein